MMKILTFLRTIKYLKLIQIYYQVKYRLRKRMGYASDIPVRTSTAVSFEWKNYVCNNESWVGNGSFTFLNKMKVFSDSKIDWNFNEYGKLWTYNLNYFDYLNQSKLSKDTGLELMKNFMANADTLVDGKEPYPTSLRLINWVKFISAHKISEDSIDDFIHEDAYRLIDNLEYHLLANHLLENGFALLFAGTYLNDSLLTKKAEEILLGQLEEQVLSDGAHFELSPMYHQLMFLRVLDSLQLLRNADYEEKPEKLLSMCEKTAAKMHSWLNNISFKNGEIPLVNDAANGINPTSNELNNYFFQLGLTPENLPLKESGYRTFDNDKYEILIDVGSVYPNYQPGHSHADTFSYVVRVNQESFITDSGTATYESNSRREYERSTAAHNTVAVNGQNSSEVWSSFRVGARASVKILKDVNGAVEAVHNGFRKTKHYRRWEMELDKIIIHDKLTRSNSLASSYIHFHPEVNIINCLKNKVLTNYGDIHVSGHDTIEMCTYGYAEEFNKIQEAQALKINFSKSIITTIEFN